MGTTVDGESFVHDLLVTSVLKLRVFNVKAFIDTWVV